MSPEAAAAAIRARISRIAEHPYLLDGAGEPLRCGRDSLLDQATYGVQRMVVLTNHALSQLAHWLSARNAHDATTPVLLALPEARPGFEASDVRALLGGLELSGTVGSAGFQVSTCGEGHAGVFQGLMQAAALIGEGRCELCIVGGVDSYLHADTLAWLDGQRRIARDGIRGGFAPGEGVAMFAVATSRARQRLRLPCLARVRSIACATEPRSLQSHEGLLGEGLSEAVRLATACLDPQEDISDIYADINGERHRSEDWGFTLLRCPEHIKDGARYITAISQCGDVGAATAGLQVVLATRAWQRGYARGSRALLLGGSWQGLRGAAVLEAGQV
ncbi:hypothetical protein [Archangium sp.]|uniref:hypothetical protein n=1 Tax=Archangium sp. TaxID=1872627 RepID=UPI002D4733D2|nr:hypothetical protein [Archangium sp.]HYO54576.1 hypothetical protein [Archangium sp.]